MWTPPPGFPPLPPFPFPGGAQGPFPPPLPPFNLPFPPPPAFAGLSDAEVCILSSSEG